MNPLIYPWKTLCMAAMTGDSSWSPQSLECGMFMPIYGGEFYVGGFQKRTYENGGISILGLDCAKFLAKFDAVILWHWPHESVLDLIRWHSGTRTKIGLAIAYEAVPQSPMWDRLTEVFRTISLKYLLKGTKPNAYGAYNVDYYENVLSLPPPQKPHCWACEVTNPKYPREFVQYVDQVVRMSYPCNKPDFYFFDSFQARPYFGQATNAPVVSDDLYRIGWNTLLRLFQSTVGPVWGHNPGLGYYPSLGNAVWEHSFRTGKDACLDNLRRATVDQRVSMGSEKQDLLRAFPMVDAWTKFREDAGYETQDNVYLETARTGSAFSLYHPGERIANR